MGQKNEIYKVLFILVLVVLMAIMGVNFLYLPMVEERDALKQENYDLESRKISLQNKAINEQVYKDNINASGQSLSEVMDRYAVGNTPEKSIMIVKGMEDTIGIEIPNVSFGAPSSLMNVQMPIVTSVEGGTGSAGYSVTYYNVGLTSETLTFNYSCTYEQLKQFSDYVNAYPERMNISSITVSHDSETGDLTGSIILNLFAVTGTDREYLDPEIEDIRLGETNIFGE